jgi:signal transduction histidine kinase
MTTPSKISLSQLEISSAWRSLNYDLSITICIVSVLSLIGNILNLNYLTTWANPWHMSIPSSGASLLAAISLYLPTTYRRITALLILALAITCRYLDYPGYAISSATMHSCFALALLMSHPKGALLCVIIPLWICFVGFSVSFLKIQIPAMETFIREMSVPTMVSSIMLSFLLIKMPFPAALKISKLYLKNLWNAIVVLLFWVIIATFIHYSSASISQSIFAALLVGAIAYIHILLQSRAKLEGFNKDLEHALNKTSSLVIVNSSGKIEYANKRYFKRANIPEGVTKKTLYQDKFLKRAKKNLFLDKLAELEKDETWQGEFCSLDSQGNPYWEETIITPITDKGQHSDRFLVISYDISSKIEQAQKLEEHQKELYNLLENNAALLHMKARLMQVSTHKMKSPLSQILSEIDTMMIKTSPRNDAYTQLRNIRKKTERVMKELNELLKFDADTHKGKYFNLSRFCLEELLDSEIEICKQEIDEKHLDFDYTCNIYQDIYHAKPAIEHIIHILLKNALERSGKHGLVRLSLKKDDSNLSISIEDHGVTISETMQDKLLNAFHTRNLIAPENKTPVGLGLSFVKELTHGLRGNIEVVNIAPQGVSIRVTLPLKDKLLEKSDIDQLQPEIEKPL